ncbi:MAG TPA: VTT domain-containing protein [Propylenella sp.]
MRPVWRLFGLFLALAILVALPFLIWGDAFEDMLGRDRLVAWLDGHRGTAWLAAIGLLVSDLLLPIPNTMVMAALGVLYGPLLGGAVAVVGNALSGLVGYGLCRRYGRPAAIRLLGERDLAAGEALFARSGGWMVAASRWLPVLPEVIACMAGLARMPFRAFLVALLCGALPLGFVVAWLGHAGADRPVLTLVLCALLPLPAWYLLRGTFAGSSGADEAAARR